MAYLTGLKKQINKANQYMSEKISGVEGERKYHTKIFGNHLSKIFWKSPIENIYTIETELFSNL